MTITFRALKAANKELCELTVKPYQGHQLAGGGGSGYPNPYPLQTTCYRLTVRGRTVALQHHWTRFYWIVFIQITSIVYTLIIPLFFKLHKKHKIIQYTCRCQFLKTHLQSCVLLTTFLCGNLFSLLSFWVTKIIILLKLIWIPHKIALFNIMQTKKKKSYIA